MLKIIQALGSYLAKHRYLTLSLFFLVLFQFFSSDLLAQPIEFTNPPASPSAPSIGGEGSTVTLKQFMEPTFDSTGGAGAPSFVVQTLVLGLLALSPFLVLIMTSFLKMIIVFSLLRQALGTQNTPPNQVLTTAAMILTFYVMFPVGYQMYEKAEDILNRPMPASVFESESTMVIMELANAAQEPLKNWLKKNTIPTHISKFYDMAMRGAPPAVRENITPNDYLIVVPAFLTTQLKEGFEIGVLIYLPFFIVDIVTSNILLAMGMMMLSPLTISLPLKLLVLVTMDGWTILIEGLVLSFR